MWLLLPLRAKGTVPTIDVGNNSIEAKMASSLRQLYFMVAIRVLAGIMVVFKVVVFLIHCLLFLTDRGLC